MPNRDIGLEILQGIHEIKADKRGKRKLRTIKRKGSAPAQICVSENKMCDAPLLKPASS